MWIIAESVNGQNKKCVRFSILPSMISAVRWRQIFTQIIWIILKGGRTYILPDPASIAVTLNRAREDGRKIAFAWFVIG